MQKSITGVTFIDTYLVSTSMLKWSSYELCKRMECNFWLTHVPVTYSEGHFSSWLILLPITIRSLKGIDLQISKLKPT